MKNCIFTAIRKANRVLFRRYQEALMGTDISIVQLSILRALERNGSLPLARLSKDLAMERTSLYRTLEPMVKAGKIKLTKADVGNAKIAELTAEGQSTIEHVMPFWAKARESIIAESGIEEWQTLQDMLRALANLES